MRSISLAIGFLFLWSVSSLACSAYKLTSGGATVFGMNYDTWFLHPRIWFEPEGYGAVFTGANDQGRNDLTPQSGMNVYGLAFGTLAIVPPPGQTTAGKEQIPRRTRYLKDILHRCRNVEEVQAYVARYDRRSLQNDLFFYTDRSGHYLVVEPYRTILDSQDRYVQSNFCPSVSDPATVRQQRYLNGKAFLRNGIDTSLAFCTALSDTMHVCRKRVGDGTLLTSVWNLSDTSVTLYFYHDYRHAVRFRLPEELKKGNRLLDVPKLFPANTEYRRLAEYKVPMSSIAIDRTLRLFFCFFLASVPAFLVTYLRRRSAPYAGYQIGLSLLALVLSGYMLMLLAEPEIFFFPAPYRHLPDQSFLDAGSYLPLLLLALFPFFLRVSWKTFRRPIWPAVPKWLLALHNLVFLVLIVLFAYWGLYHIW